MPTRTGRPRLLGAENPHPLADDAAVQIDSLGAPAAGFAAVAKPDLNLRALGRLAFEHLPIVMLRSALPRYRGAIGRRWTVSRRNRFRQLGTRE
ncbi:MAG: hypothetical protein ABI808_01185 [Pseudonocardiales bacterium]